MVVGGGLLSCTWEGRGEIGRGNQKHLILAVIKPPLNSLEPSEQLPGLCLKYSLSVYEGVRDTVSFCKI